MHHHVTDAAPKETGALIDRIPTNHHKMQRADLAPPVPLASHVEKVHADDPEAPNGLANALTRHAREIGAHMAREEMIQFLAMHAGRRPGIEHPVAVMRADHEDHAASISLIPKPTADPLPSENGCGSWRSLDGGATTLLEELAAHIALDNTLLFPRLEAAR